MVRISSSEPLASAMAWNTARRSGMCFRQRARDDYAASRTLQSIRSQILVGCADHQRPQLALQRQKRLRIAGQASSQVIGSLARRGLTAVRMPVNASPVCVRACRLRQGDEQSDRGVSALDAPLSEATVRRQKATASRTSSGKEGGAVRVLATVHAVGLTKLLTDRSLEALNELQTGPHAAVLSTAPAFEPPAMGPGFAHLSVRGGRGAPLTRKRRLLSQRPQAVPVCTSVRPWTV